MQTTIVPNSSECLIPQPTRWWGIESDVQGQISAKSLVAVGSTLIT